MKKKTVKPVPVYLCDPKVNIRCTKESCFLNHGGCFKTLDKKYAIEGAGAFMYFYKSKIIEG